MIPVAKELVEAFQKRNPDAAIDVITEDLGTTGGIKALDAGRVNMVLAARALRPDEKNGNLHRPLGRAPVVFAVHKNVGVTGLKQSELCDLYQGKVASWRDVGGARVNVALLTRNEDEGTKEAVRTSLSCFKSLRESADAAVLGRSTAMVAKLRWDAGTIGMTQLDAAEHSGGAFSAIAIDGVAPSLEAVRSGKYRMVEEYALVTRGEPQGVARRFVEFAASADAVKILAANGVLPPN